MQTPNGFLLIDKPAGMTSFGVVARVRRRFSEQTGKKVKVGHTGTLDPFATGLMIIVVGDYCKRAGEFSKMDKSYQATVRLGAASTTGDPEGEITPAPGSHPTRTQIDAVLPKFTGAIQQTPPIFSAIKINGQRAYKLARAGKTIEIPARTVTVHSLQITDYNYPELNFTCHVSSGTYIRTLAQDIATALGTSGYTTQLRRTQVDRWDVKDALNPETSSIADLRLL
ncbi:MAG TPA: tRNA pseudouridine(55) synthase TruB [Candidatus Saccharimonas sp.]|nr:tRNA pseudouridine(55) synthase TruB [Candidatus Saccharimonas sp.]